MIAAVESCSFVDFAGRLAAVAFTQDCDLRCRYCHNPELCERKPTSPQVMDDLLRLPSQRRGLLSVVVVCGGEPTLCDELASLLQGPRLMDSAIKLDTNGLHPERTSRLVEQGLIDYLAVVSTQPHGTGVVAAEPAASATCSVSIAIVLTPDLRISSATRTTTW